MSNIIPKSSTWIVVLAGFVICAVVALLYGSNFHAVLNRTFFKVGFIVGIAGMIGTAIYWVSSLSDPAYEEKSNRMWTFVVAFAFTFAWIAGWSSQYKVDKEDHIEYNGK